MIKASSARAKAVRMCQDKDSDPHGCILSSCQFFSIGAPLTIAPQVTILPPCDCLPGRLLRGLTNSHHALVLEQQHASFLSSVILDRKPVLLGIVIGVSFQRHLWYVQHEVSVTRSVGSCSRYHAPATTLTLLELVNVIFLLLHLFFG